MFYFIIYPFNYLRLRDEESRLVVRRDVLPVALFVIALVSLFEFLPDTNFYAKDGFVERVGGVTQSLTGFYIAGLLAVATFTISQTALDQPIKVGPVYLRRRDQNNCLSRREYVCLMFGYLSALSLAISLFAALSGATAKAIGAGLEPVTTTLGGTVISARVVVGLIGKIVVAIVVSHIVLTTGYGLYYLTKKIYERDSVIGKKDSSRLG